MLEFAGEHADSCVKGFRQSEFCLGRLKWLLKGSLFDCISLCLNCVNLHPEHFAAVKKSSRSCGQALCLMVTDMPKAAPPPPHTDSR